MYCDIDVKTSDKHRRITPKSDIGSIKILNESTYRSWPLEPPACDRKSRIVPGKPGEPNVEEFLCGKCGQVLARYEVTGMAKSLALIIERHCGQYWEVW
jgi:hypothetical protein